MQYILRTRAVVLHTGMTIIKILYAVTGSAVYQRNDPSCYGSDVLANDVSEVNDNCVPLEFREDFVDSYRDLIKGMAYLMLVLTILLDFAALKWRNMADYIIYVEMFNSLVVSTIPST